MTTAEQTVPEGTLAARLDQIEQTQLRIEGKIDAQSKAINDLIDTANSFAELANNFSIPASFAALFGGKKPSSNAGT
jgi:hypothetical protein